MASKQKKLSKRESVPAPKIPDVVAEPKVLSPKLQKTLDKNLLCAAMREEWGRMVSLLEGGAKADERTTTRFSALTYAAARGQTKIVQMIIDAGAEVSIKDTASRVAYVEAVAGKHKETADLLLTIGKLGAGNSIPPLPPLTPEQEAAVAEIEYHILSGGKF
ncbi:MAG: ankyrin repeat domain-containing protein [bacterium]|nr:ankyrin repeat domain-containing protein [bacterium]